jgi:cytochrome d ubiquinol oxidase subunit I
VLAVVTLEAGWVVTEVGRQPWVVYNLMRVENAATANHGVWISFILVVLLYLALAVTTIAVLRGMSLRFRRSGGFDDSAGPYGPIPEQTTREERPTEEAVR